jgi:hypothetical protein
MSLPTEHPGEILSRIANGAVSVRRFVKNNGAQASVTGEKVLGVSRDSADTGKSFPVVIDGTALVEAGAAIAADTEVMTDSLGRAIKAVNGRYIAGRTMTSVSAAAKDVEVLLMAGAGTSVPWTTTTTTSSTTTTTTA